MSYFLFFHFLSNPNHYGGCKCKLNKKKKTSLLIITTALRNVTWCVDAYIIATTAFDDECDGANLA